MPPKKDSKKDSKKDEKKGSKDDDEEKEIRNLDREKELQQEYYFNPVYCTVNLLVLSWIKSNFMLLLDLDLVLARNSRNYPMG
jgi:hypothetical protein